MSRIFIFCISLLTLVACNDSNALENKQCRKTNIVPGLVVSRRIAVRKMLQKCIEKDTSLVENDIKFK